MYKLILILISTLMISAITNAEELDFKPTSIGKFRNCSFIAQCEKTTSCSDILDCSHLAPSVEKCDKKWKEVKLPFGIKNKIPEVSCRKVKNQNFLECNSKRRVQESQCKERQIEENQTCQDNARNQESQCNLIKTAEINAAQDLYEKLIDFHSTLDKFESKIIAVESTYSPDLVEIKVIESKDYSSFFSFLYDKTKFIDWNGMPSIGYSRYRAFLVIGDYLILPPNQRNTAVSDDIKKYAALNSLLTKKIGLDGISQLYIHNPAYIEEYLISPEYL